MPRFTAVEEEGRVSFATNLVRSGRANDARAVMRLAKDLSFASLEPELESELQQFLANRSDLENEVGSNDADGVRSIPRVTRVYKIIRKSTGALGGSGHAGCAIYGELTMGSMQRIIDVLVQKCELDTTSLFLDIGSGLGKPNFHAAQDPAVRLSFGVELENIRYQVTN